MTGGPWYNTYICKKLHGKFVEGFIKNARTDRHNTMCSIDAYKKEDWSSCDNVISGADFPLPSNITTESLVFLGSTIYSIGCWLKALEHNVLERYNMYVFNMNKSFQKITVELLKQPSPKKNENNYYMLFEVVGMRTN